DIRLLPNPNKGDFILKGTMGTTEDKELNAEITDMLGQVVYRSKVQARNGVVNERIQISNTLANGMYILNLRSETEAKAFHFVLQQ
ncbi:MAG: T9SS type A sorting domain-containing protein, partial [Taibaiella sp.]|nr:T9SS type A sorting domain-containing protein [Taibaiella sp.]